MTTTSPAVITGLVVGAYAAAPGADQPEDRAAYYRALAQDRRIGALEVPWTPELTSAADLPDRADGVGIVLTALPTTMGRRSADPRYGLAATDPVGRAQALADVRRMCDLVARLNTDAPVVRAVEVHSSPRPDEGAAEAFADTLAEICRWDWCGSAVLVEHCDGVTPDHLAEKGFLTIEDELAAVARVRDEGRTATGLVINWGRSALEGRSADTAAAHIALAAGRGLLAGIIFSGVAAVPTAAGPAWADLHLAPAPVAPDSLLDDTEILRSLGAAGDGGAGFVGLKVGFGYEARPLADRVGLVTQSLDVLAAARPADAVR